MPKRLVLATWDIRSKKGGSMMALTFPLLFQCQAGGEKVTYMAVYLSRFGTNTPNGQ
jgi:hypothetical protein